MENLEVSLTAKNTAYEGENNADSVKLTLPEYLRGFDSYIIRRRDGYGEVTDSERLYEQDGAVTMPLTADILRGNKLQLQLIAFDGDTVSKSEPVTLEVGLSLRLTAEKQEEYSDLTAEMLEALNRADNLKDGFSPTVSVKQNAVGHEVSITDKDGEKKFSVPNGKDGKTPQKNVDYFDGKDGKSAYQTAKESGYKGTEKEFGNTLANLTNTLAELDRRTEVLKEIPVPEPGDSLLLGIPPIWTDPERKLGFYSQIDIGDIPMRDWLIELIKQQISEYHATNP